MIARYDFHGRTALITGGAGGIGAAVARALQSGGAQVATFDSRATDLDGVLAIEGDVRRSEDVDAAVARVGAELGPLDIAVCAAGVSGDSLATVDVGDEEWRRVFAINCDGVFFTNRAAARVMVPHGYGRIVNVASIAGKEGNPTLMPYSASNGIRRVRLRPDALGSSTRQSPSSRATGCFGLSMIVAATKQCVAPSSSGTSLQAAARKASGSQSRQSSSTSDP